MSQNATQTTHEEPIDRPEPPTSDDQTRFYLALVMATLVAVLALTSVVQPSASTVLDKVLPLLTLVLGYFFGQKVRRAHP